ncbi:MAG: Rrf2 family transcriptional regulator [Sulfurospirillum sp.]|nr:Rrf2 family transcriptional regulator [Sulfurospirillum sp.]
MALISTKGLYGLAALYELFLSDHNKSLQIKDIATRANIPQNYLEQILVLLKKADFVKSTRGVNGGYMLAKSPKMIFIKDIFLTLEGDIGVVDAHNSNAVLESFYASSKKELQEIFALSLYDLHKKYSKPKTPNATFSTFGL